ncbi:hypothetical protein [Desulfospira joergensenii]|uniref:hypothetical protein n=1 Tax=Desulfospira joergensenii TaxID=53329 RepID=UPI0003B355A1|nr:hypothetical protein [Desulfospira joergensenii]
MKIVDCLPNMSMMYLKRIVNSILKDDITKGDEERHREQISQNEAELFSDERIRKVLDLESYTRSQRILTEGILNGLLMNSEMACPEDKLFKFVQKFEQDVIDEAKSEDAFKFSDPKAVEIYETVLEIALEDDHVSVDEFRMLERLRVKLGITRREHRLLEAKLGKFPQPNNELHNSNFFSDVAKYLQAIGILFCCNKMEGGAVLVLPEEIAPNVKSILGFEMKPDSQKLMHEALSTDQLRSALKYMNMPLSGSKTERSERLLIAGCKPSEILSSLRNEELAELCKKLKGVKISGTKSERIDNIIQYYDGLTVKKIKNAEDPRAIWYEYLVELAHRDNQNLYSQNLIRHDRDMESGFEKGTRYLFEKKLGFPLIEMPGTEHSDGGVSFPNGELLLWDNKGKESVYEFPKAHFDQFKNTFANL